MVDVDRALEIGDGPCERARAVLPGREKELGRVREDQILVASVEQTSSGPVCDVAVAETGD